MSDDRQYPDLSEEAENRAVEAMKRFHADLKKVADRAMDEIYLDIASHVKSDSWTNFRNSIWEFVLGYKTLGKHEARRLRDRIFEENREQILKEIGEDLHAQIVCLKERLDEAYDRRRSF